MIYHHIVLQIEQYIVTLLNAEKILSFSPKKWLHEEAHVYGSYI